ncbi:hypothetical protein LNTAR_14992 [Lentisphaera araneosa HTCC2155]|uniref:Phage terminase large subunit GpA ATPase domain-containing protein n=1 Tax=Lentisphaera araneosa HTCC2155 TaxID=313628 RepID=A6DHQ0_9BACT|nr:phage terminase large subunit family protein [Lentisphaera araneosa]EDM29133.1 hypothetical protein LNTAR_14992 [Lentisphaera araneosa HTCC2155]
MTEEELLGFIPYLDKALVEELLATGVITKEMHLSFLSNYTGATGDISVYLPYTAQLKGNPYSLLNFPMFRPLFNLNLEAQQVTYQCCRQVGKTESLSSLVCLKARVRDNYNSLVVAPRHEQATRISAAKTIPFLKESLAAKLPKFYVDSLRDVHKQEITLKNQNKIYFIGCYLSPDAARGLSTECVYYDEYQDINPEHTPVVNACKDGSMLYGEEYYFGTPKSTSGPLTEKFMEGSQGYWCVSCPSCDKEVWANDDIDDAGSYACERIIGIEGPTCIYCEYVFTFEEVLYKGYYKHRHPERLKKQIIEGREVLGKASYHICQSFHPAHMVSKAKWADLYNKANGSMDRVTFLNECMGIAADRGNVLITPQELADCCSEDATHINSLQSALTRSRVKNSRVYIAIDWSGFGGQASDSYTSLVIFRQDLTRPDYIEVLYLERLSKDLSPEQTTQHVHKLVQQFPPYALVHDQTGAGFVVETLLKQKVKNVPVIGISYTGGNGNLRLETVAVNSAQQRSGITLSKTRSLEMFYLLLKGGYVKLPTKDSCWKEITDLLNLQRESRISRNGTEEMFITRFLGRSDDFAHALNMGVTFALYKTNGYPNLQKKFFG